MYKAVFIDMDGTLLQTDHTISDVNKNAIQKLLTKGIMVVPISARPLHGMLPITNPVLPANMPVVSLNGSYIFHNNQVIYQADISLEEVVAIQNEIKLYDITVMYYSQMEWYAAEETAMIKREQKITPVKIKIQPFEQMMAGWESQKIGPNKILIAGDKDLILTIEQQLLELHKEKLNIYKSQPAFLEVMNLQASKSKAVELLIHQFGIQRSEIIAIGDNYNDKGMIEFAGVGIAMGNAPDEIKMIADYVTDTNDNHGVAKALDRFF